MKQRSLLKVCLAVMVGTATVWAQEFIEIRTLNELQKIGSGIDGWTMDASYLLMNDIDASATATWNGGAGFTPIGNQESPFRGYFEGQGYVIRNLTINRPTESEVGLFGHVEGALVYDVGLLGGSIFGQSLTGGLAGWASDSALGWCAINCRVRGGANGGYEVGGLAGRLNGCEIRNCSIAGTVSGNDVVGGICGFAGANQFYDCMSVAAVAGWSNVGGMVGGEPWDIYSEGSGNAQVDCFWDVTASGQTASIIGTGLTTPQMKQQASFTGFDFSSTWTMVEDVTYPYLNMFPPPFSLYTATVGSGSVAVLSKQASYAAGASVQLTATAAAGSEFVEWVGIGVTTRVVTVKMDSHRYMVARFRVTKGIGTIADLQKIGRDPAFPLDGRYWLTIDIDASATVAWNAGAGFIPLGSGEVGPFTGKLDGRGFTVKNLTVDRRKLNSEEDVLGIDVGLFGTVLGGTLENIRLTGARIAVVGDSDHSVGGLAGRLEKGTIRQCSVTGGLLGDESAGGLVGRNEGGLIERCFASVGLDADYEVGGLIGSSRGGTVRDCFASGVIAGFESVGGLVGYADGGQVQRCLSSVQVFGDEGAVGGLIGANGSDEVTASYWDTERSGCAADEEVAGEGKTTAELKQAASFAEWNMTSVWAVVAGRSYPYLRWSPPPFRLETIPYFSGTIARGLYGDAFMPGTLVPLTATPAAGYLLSGWYGAGAVTNALKTTVLMDSPRVAVAAFDRAIRNIQELQKIGNDPTYPLDEYYVLASNIDASVTATWNGGAGFKPLGTIDQPFTGTLEGKGHVIRNLTIARTGEEAGPVGLIGFMEDGGSVENLTLDNCSILGSDDVGAVVGLNMRGSLYKCSAAGVVKGRDSVGGLVGRNESGDVEQCRSQCSVSGVRNVGGLAGWNAAGWIWMCSAGGNVMGFEGVGALVGSAIESLYSGPYGGAGGWVDSSYATGLATGDSRVGGLIGWSEADWVVNCYATGPVQGSTHVGGLIGRGFSGNVYQCYSVGEVSGFSDAGGLVGSAGEALSVAGYWDIEASGIDVSAGGEGRSTAEMKQAATFAGWDFDWFWESVEGVSYPYLRMSPPPFTLRAQAQGSGSVLVSPLQPAYAPGTVVRLTASAAANAEFVGWIGAGIWEVTNVVNVTMDRSRTVIAVFRTAREITGLSELQKIGNDPAFTLNGRYWLSADIDASVTALWNNGEGFAPIGTVVTPFTGTFDGQGHVIRNLYIKRTVDAEKSGAGAGLFGTVSGATIRNVGIVGGSVWGAGPGGNCSVGGLIGYGEQTTVEQCFAYISVFSSVTAGGLVGRLDYGSMSRCYALGAPEHEQTGSDVTSFSYCGGLVGELYGSAISECFSVASAAQWGGSAAPGGLAGNAVYSVEGDCYWDAEASGCSESAAGTGLTTALMKQAATFAAWDFETAWSIAEDVSYPYLQMFGDPFYLVVNTEGPGTVAVNPLQASYAPGTVVQLTAIATPGMGEFIGWSRPGFDETYDAVLEVTMDAQKYVKARFRTACAIGRVQDLQKIGRDPAFTENGHYWLTNNLNAAGSAAWNGGTGFMPINMFSGTLDGQGHVISNLVIKTSEEGCGLIGYLDGGIIRNLGLVSVQVTGPEEFSVGGLVGVNAAEGTIERCYVTGSVTGSDASTGGLVGNNNGQIIRCHAFATVSGQSDVGGLVGSMDGGTIVESFASCLVSGKEEVGGLVGNSYFGSLLGCYAAGSVQGVDTVGGALGYGYNTGLSSVYSAAAVSGKRSVGGLIGIADNEEGGYVDASYWDLERSQCGESAGGLGLATARMRQQGSFEGWDFADVWSIKENASYPYLRWSPPPFRLDAVVSGQGSITRSPAAVTNAAGSVVTLTATAATGFLFKGWYGLGPVTNAATVKVTMDGHRVVRAVFTRSISTLAELQKIGNDSAYPLDGSYALKSDIDASLTATWNSGKGFKPIGTPDAPFTGEFDGRGFAVKGLTVKRPDENGVGLFGAVNDGTLENVRLTMAAIQGTNQVGALAGGVYGYGLVRNCSAGGKVSGQDDVGGLIGSLSARVEKSYALCSVAGHVNVGGLSGRVQGGFVSACFANGAVAGNMQVGGLVGYLIPVPRYYSDGCVYEEDWFYAEGGQAVACTASGRVEGIIDVGGLVGFNDRGTVQACYSMVDVTGVGAVGGLVGSSQSNGYDWLGRIDSCYAQGAVWLAESEDYYEMPYAGGLVGWNAGNVWGCYAAGTVAELQPTPDSWHLGGLVGAGEAMFVFNSYWDREKAPLEASGGGESRTTYEMCLGETFPSWDFEQVWGLDEGSDYPYLRAFDSYGFGSVWMEVPESERSVTVTVLGGLADKASSVAVTLLPGTAGISDYTVPAAAALKLSWLAGEIGPKTVTIPLIPDALVEGNEEFYVMLGSPVGGVITRPRYCVVTILDDDSGETLGRALDNTALTWSTVGAALWKPQQDGEAANGSAAFSGLMATGKVSYVQATGSTGAGWLSFGWRSVFNVGTRAPRLRLLEGTTVLWSSPEESANSGWQSVEIERTAAVAHTFKWEVAQGSDPAGFVAVDSVTWMPRLPTDPGVATVALSTTQSEGGWLAGSGQYWVGAKVTIEAKAKPGWRFVKWSDGGTVPTRLVTLAGDIEWSAIFAQTPYVIGAPNKPEAGKVTGGGYCLPGKTVTLTAAANAGYTLLRWEDGSQAASRVVTEAQATAGMDGGMMRCMAFFVPTALLAAPQVRNPGSQEAMVGVPFRLPLDITSDSAPTVTVTGLPAGIVYKPATRTIEGVPTAPTPTNGTPALVKVSISNAGHLTDPAMVSFALRVAPLPAWAVGTFNGRLVQADMIDGCLDDGDGLSEPAALSVTALGAVSGKLTVRTTNYAFTAASYLERWSQTDESGRLTEGFLIETTVKVGTNALPIWVNVVHQDNPDNPDAAPRTLSVAYGESSAVFPGTETLGFRLFLYRNVWKDAGMASVLAPYVGYYTAILPVEGIGNGYLAITVDSAGGVKAAGKLADGTAVSQSGTLVLDESGGVWTFIYAAPAAYRGGTFFGTVGFSNPDEGPVIIFPWYITPLRWESRNPQATSEYGVGFRCEPWLTGGKYSTLINLRDYYETGLVVGGVETLPQLLATVRVTDYLPDSLSKTTVSFQEYFDSAGVLPNGIFLGITPATGAGTGFVAPAAQTPAKVVDPETGDYMGYNYGDLVNPTGFTFSFTRATGLFTGSFNVYYDYVSAIDNTTWTETLTHTSVKATYEGVLVPEREGKGTGPEGGGFFLWASQGYFDSGKKDAYGEPVMTPYTFNRSFNILLSAF